MRSTFDLMMDLLNMDSIEEMWDSWNKIADEVIPPSFDIVDAADGANYVRVDTDQGIRDRIEYLSDRLDPARCYWLDFNIRQYLGKPLRDKT
jgi:hypothetical protein